MNVKSLAKVNHVFAIIASIVVLALLANITSHLVWQWVSPQDISALTFKNQPQVEEKVLVNTDLLKSHALFGIPPVQREPVKQVKFKPTPAPIVKIRPKTTLLLLGILQFGDFYSAVIKSNGFEESYSVGEFIGHLMLLRIGKDFVVFNDEGIETTVYLDQGEITIGGNQPPPTTSENTLGASNNAALPTNAESGSYTPEAGEKTVVKVTPKQKEKLLTFKKILAKNPLEMLEKVKTTPYRQNGKITGFQVFPGSEKALFAALKLNPGDIIVQINGKSLSEISNFTDGMKLMNSLSQQTILDMVISRRGSEERILIDLNN